MDGADEQIPSRPPLGFQRLRRFSLCNPSRSTSPHRHALLHYPYSDPWAIAAYVA